MSVFTINGKQAAALWAAANKKDDRPYLTYVQIRAQSYGSDTYIAEAADGHVLVQVVISYGRLGPDPNRLPLVFPAIALKKIRISETVLVDSSSGEIKVLDRYDKVKYVSKHEAKPLREVPFTFLSFDTLFPTEGRRVLRVGLSRKVIKQLVGITTSEQELAGTLFEIEIPDNLDEQVGRVIVISRGGDSPFRGLIMPCKIERRSEQ